MGVDKEKLIGLILGVLIMSVICGYLIFAWQEPTLPPPQGNVPAPLNVSLNPQAKEGALVIATNPSILTAQNPAGLIVQYGNVGIGTTIPTAKLHIDINDTTTTPFQVENSVGVDPNLMPGWNYRRPITVSNTSKALLTDYQVLITLNTASLISVGKMRLDCGDIRFTDSDGTTLLNYWIESGCNSANTKIWVKVPQIPAHLTKTIYLYYGNSNATSQSNPTNVFIFFDDAEIDYGNWELIQGRWHRESGSACVYQGAYGWTYSAGCFGGWYPYESAVIQSRAFNLPANTAIDFYTKGGVSLGSFCFEISYNGGSSWHSLWCGGDDVWKTKLLIPQSSSNTKIRFRIYTGGGCTGCGVVFDVLKIRKYTHPDTFTWVGQEERLSFQMQTTFYVQPVTGNIGIGTTSPSFKLDVAGRVNATELCIAGLCKSSWSWFGAMNLECQLISKEFYSEGSVECDPGYRIITGGCAISGSCFPLASPYWSGFDAFHPTGNGWFCSDNGGSCRIRVYALCCK